VIDQIWQQLQSIEAPIRAADGASIGSSTEIIAHKRAQAANEQLAGIVRSSQDGIASFSLDGTMLTWNHGLERMLGYTADEVIGHNRSIFVPPIARTSSAISWQPFERVTISVSKRFACTRTGDASR